MIHDIARALAYIQGMTGTAENLDPAADPRPNLLGMDRAAIERAIAGLDAEPFRADQLYNWIYARGVTDLEAMTNLSMDLRQRLAADFRIELPRVALHQRSEDGTQKWLLDFDDHNAAETVHIPEPDRGTLCISSQVGCTLTCAFCHTGTQRLVRNLGPGEIVGQVMLARHALDAWGPRVGSAEGKRRLTNIVFMGMGEPLYNFDNVKAALATVMDGDGIGISRHRITLSTSGIVPEIGRCGEELGVLLAVSLHAVTDELRDRLVPINRKYPLRELLQACRDYPAVKNARRITFEYVMLRDVNDSEAEARELTRLLAGIPAKVNLLPFNPWPGVEFECSTELAMQRFAAIVEKAGYVCTVRRPRGRDILAACGQLKTASERKPASAR